MALGGTASASRDFLLRSQTSHPARAPFSFLQNSHRLEAFKSGGGLGAAVSSSMTPAPAASSEAHLSPLDADSFDAFKKQRMQQQRFQHSALGGVVAESSSTPFVEDSAFSLSSARRRAAYHLDGSSRVNNTSHDGTNFLQGGANLHHEFSTLQQQNAGEAATGEAFMDVGLSFGEGFASSAVAATNPEGTRMHRRRSDRAGSSASALLAAEQQQQQRSPPRAWSLETARTSTHLRAHQQQQEFTAGGTLSPNARLLRGISSPERASNSRHVPQQPSHSSLMLASGMGRGAGATERSLSAAPAASSRRPHGAFAGSQLLTTETGAISALDLAGIEGVSPPVREDGGEGANGSSAIRSLRAPLSARETGVCVCGVSPAISCLASEGTAFSFECLPLEGSSLAEGCEFAGCAKHSQTEGALRAAQRKVRGRAPPPTRSPPASARTRDVSSRAENGSPATQATAAKPGPRTAAARTRTNSH